MKRVCLIFVPVILFLGAWGLFASPRHVNLVTVDGPIGPITARIIDQAIDASVEDSAEALVIELNTPGGLDESMRIITRKILNSGIPVIVYVAPSGSRAASAGVFITLSAHVAAMSPGTNMGSAHPVAIGGQMDSTMAEKVVNDAAAYIRSIASRRGRNEEWAEESVRESISATEYEALKLNVIDLVVDNVRALLDSCDGRKVSLPSGEKTLETKEIEVRRVEISVRDRILQVITNPTIAYILLTLGIWGLFFELSNPGAIFPGIVGGICLILAFFALQTLPINYAGLLLMILALILFILEVKIVSHGALAIGGIISMVLGSLLLFESPLPYMRVSLVVIITVVAGTALFFLVAIGLALRARKRKVTTGGRGLTGEVGVARSALKPEGDVFIHGEIWRAEADQPIKKGEKVVVTGMEHLTLKVTKHKKS
ncbi:MAG: nodulation protein NfeD [Candidatus Zixiibacteriota bacterium]